MKAGRDLWAVSLDGGQRPISIAATQFDEKEGQFSADGRWVAYESSASGRFEIYVQSFPVPAIKRMISTAGGEHPRWRRDGKEVFYFAPDGSLISVPITPATTGQDFEPSPAVTLFKPPILPATGGLRQQYDVSADGQRLLMVTQDEAATGPIVIIQNWTAALPK